MDYISELPEPIIHHILSFLTAADPADALQTTVLSKQFQSAWHTFHIVDLDQLSFRCGRGLYPPFDEQLLNDFLGWAYSFVRFHKQHVKIDKFRLYIPFLCTHWDARIDELIEYAFDNCIGEVDICTRRDACESVGGAVAHLFYGVQTTSYAAKTFKVTTLRLEGLHFEADLFSSFPLLENLSVNSCDADGEFRLSSATLKCFEWTTHRLDYMHKVEINAPNLEILRCSYAEEIVMISCGKFIRELTIRNSNITSEWLHEQFPNFLALEAMELYHCSKLSYIRLASNELKSVVVSVCENMQKVNISARNLKFFLFEPCTTDKFNVGFLNLNGLRFHQAPLLVQFIDGHPFHAYGISDRLRLRAPLSLGVDCKDRLALGG